MVTNQYYWHIFRYSYIYAELIFSWPWKIITHVRFLKTLSIHTCMHMHTCKTLTQVKQCGTDFSPHPLQYRVVSIATSSSFWHWKVETCRKYVRPPGSSQENGWRARSVDMWGGGVLKSWGFKRLQQHRSCPQHSIACLQLFMSHYWLLDIKIVTVFKPDDVLLSCKSDGGLVAQTEGLTCRSRVLESTLTSFHLLCWAIKWSRRWDWPQLSKQLKLLWNSNSEDGEGTLSMQHNSSAAGSSAARKVVFSPFRTVKVVNLPEGIRWKTLQTIQTGGQL